MKPLLERHRRARINRCLESLRELMIDSTNSEDASTVSKLEKADVLELTVKHLRKLTHQHRSPQFPTSNPIQDVAKFQAGFVQCATEVNHFLHSTPNLGHPIKDRVNRHLSMLVDQLKADKMSPMQVKIPQRKPYSPPVSPVSPLHHSTSFSAPSSLTSRSSSDVSFRLTSTPSADDLLKPHTGLLMPVTVIYNDTKSTQSSKDEPLNLSDPWRPW